ncbi:MAG: hypothetical protein KIT00_06330 [Rhodospirillales bacterium]|nr:hypothetical protein [Rhodospirillales bacterium]
MPKTDNTTAALADVTARLQAHSESLRRDIRRLQQALADINSAMSMSMQSVDKMRANTERLHRAFGPPKRPTAAPIGRRAADTAAPQPPIAERRAEADRRASLDRRRPTSEISGLLRWIEGTSLDRRRGSERRRLVDRRCPEFGMSVARLSSRQRTSEPPPRPTANNIVSLAAVRAERKRASKTE